MTEKPSRTRQRTLLKATLPRVLGRPLPPYAKLRGASPFAVALDHATKEQVDKAQRIAGLVDAARMVSFYKKTNNPVWLLIALSVSPEEAVPAEVMTYFRSCAKQILGEVVERMKEMDRVRIEEGKSPEEGIVRQLPRRREAPDLGHLLQLSHTGRNLFQEAAKDIRSVSMAIAVEELTRNEGYTRDKAYVTLGTSNGLSSVETGPAVARIRKIVDRGRRLLGFLPGPRQ